MRLASVVCCVFLLAAGIGGAQAFDSAKDVGAAFCASRLSNDERALRVLFSSSLTKAVEEAEARNKAIAEATPGDKPPFGDGIPYQGFIDHAPVCQAGEAREVSNHIEIEIKYAFPDAPGANWTDRLKLLPQAEGFLIDDIFFADVADGTPDQGLRLVLFEAFDQ